MPERGIVRRDYCVTVPGGTAAVHFMTPRNPPAPEAPVLVFLHEGLGSIGLWKDFPAALAAATGCMAIVYDRPGHGRLGAAAKPRKPNYFETEAYDVLPALLDGAGAMVGALFASQDIILIGHSDGGTIALLHAGRYPVRGVIVEAAHVFVEDISVQGVETALKLWRETLFSERLARYHGRNTSAIFEAWSTMWLADWFRDWSIAPDLAKIECPVLAMQGVDDEYGTMAQLDAIERGVAGPVEIRRLSNCGHSPHLQSFRCVLSAMTNFVTKSGMRSPKPD